MLLVQSPTRRRVAPRGPDIFSWLTVLLSFISSSNSNAFFASPSFTRIAGHKCEQCTRAKRVQQFYPSKSLHSSGSSDVTEASDKFAPLTHSDIEWRLRPPEGTSRLNRLKLKLGANILRLDTKLKGRTLPPVLCPRGGQAVLEAYFKEPGQRKKKIARFGITTSRGPTCEEIDTTIRELYKINPRPGIATIAAIIYMFVEPEYRKLGVGSLALEVISAIHSVQAVDFTVLVADDNGSGKLVQWYESNGFLKAPLMQKVLGSPDGKFGVSMICPVSVKEGFFDKCQVKWW